MFVPVETKEMPRRYFFSHLFLVKTIGIVKNVASEKRGLAVWWNRRDEKKMMILVLGLVVEDMQQGLKEGI